MANPNRIRLVAQRAMRDYEILDARTRYELLLGLADILPEAEAEAARHAAFLINEAEIKQLHFTQMLGGGSGV